MRINPSDTLPKVLETLLGNKEHLISDKEFISELTMACLSSTGIDPESIFSIFTIPCLLDLHQIYDDDIKTLWERVCKKSAILMGLVLRSVQMGILTRQEILDAISTQETILKFSWMYAGLKVTYPEFDPSKRFVLNNVHKLLHDTDSGEECSVDAVARWWGNCLRSTHVDTSDAETIRLDTVRNFFISIKRYDELQIFIFEKALKAIMLGYLMDGERGPVYHDWKARCEPRTKKKRLLKKWYKRYIRDFGIVGTGQGLTLPNNLRKIISYAYPIRGISFGVDNDPDKPLFEACEIAGIPCNILTFPNKTRCYVNLKWAGVCNNYSKTETIFGNIQAATPSWKIKIL